MESWSVVQSWLVASSTIIDSYAMEVWKGFICRGSMEGCTELVGCIEYHKRFLSHGSAKGCIELVGCIEYHKRFLRRGSVE